MEAQLLGVILPQLSHNILSNYLSVLLILIPYIHLGNDETLSLVLLPYSGICSPLNWFGRIIVLRTW